MRTVRTDDGDRYLLLEESDDSCLVRDPQTGRTRTVPSDALTDCDDASPLATAAAGVPDPVVAALTAAHDERSLGLLCTLVDRGPTPVRTLLDVADYCESDLHGLLAEFRAAGLVATTTVVGERGYEPTDEAVAAVAHLRDDPEERD
jgi:hypothetical protein